MSDTTFKVLMAADASSFHTARFADELRRQGCTVRVISLEPGEIEHVSLRRRFPVSTVAYALAAREMARIIESFQPDIINAHYAAGYGFMVARLGRPRPPIVLHVWGSDILRVPARSWIGRRKVVAALRAAGAVVADSEYLAGAVRELVDVKRIEVISWGIEAKYLTQHKVDYHFSSPLRIIVPRMHEPVYNNIFILKALAEPIRSGQIELTVPDFGSRVGDFRREASRLTGDRVHYYQRCDRDEFIKLMASHDVYLSAAQSDSSPVSLIEAMALGLVPVVGDIPGVHEWLTEGSGYLFPVDNPDRLREIVGQLVDESGDAAVMRRANLNRVREHGLFEENMRRQIDLMRDVAGKRAGG